jgi:hypothetical protein
MGSELAQQINVIHARLRLAAAAHDAVGIARAQLEIKRLLAAPKPNPQIETCINEGTCTL